MYVKIFGAKYTIFYLREEMYYKKVNVKFFLITTTLFRIIFQYFHYSFFYKIQYLYIIFI